MRLCDKCFMMLAPDSEFCKECGAPVDGDTAHLSGSDAAIYPELARANLFRMRGEYRQAEDVCRAILRRYPNNATAAGLLGDICAEEGNLEDAARWYELALDTLPDSERDKQKLEAIQRRLAERQRQTTVDALGIPARAPRTGLYVVLMLVFLAIVGIAAFLLGRRASELQAARPGNQVTLPYEVGQGPAPAAKPPVEDAPATQVRSLPSELLAALRPLSPEGAKLLDAWQDPRTRTVFLAFEIAQGDNERFVAVALARSALGYLVDAQTIVLRGVRDGKDAYAADVTRAAVATAAANEGLRDDATGFANAVLTNEWPPTQGDAARSDPPSGTGTGDPGSATGGGASGTSTSGSEGNGGGPGETGSGT